MHRKPLGSIALPYERFKTHVSNLTEIKAYPEPVLANDNRFSTTRKLHHKKIILNLSYRCRGRQILLREDIAHRAASWRAVVAQDSFRQVRPCDRDVLRACGKRISPFLECFPYVCPEPVLVK